MPLELKHQALRVRSLDAGDFDGLYLAFKAAFADYPAAVRTERDHFALRQQRVGTEYALSAGAFDGKRMVAFVLTATGRFQGAPTAYNGGTGVLPDYRGRKLSERLYAELLPKLHAAGLRQCLLEVDESNRPARAVYRRLGFADTRSLRSFGQPRPLPERPCRLPLRLSVVEEPDWETYRHCSEPPPDWQASDERLTLFAERLRFVEAVHEGRTVGFAAFEPKEGRLFRLAVRPDARRQGVGNALLRAAGGLSRRKLTYVNLDASAEGGEAFLRAHGFTNFLRQTEMIKEL